MLARSRSHDLGKQTLTSVTLDPLHNSYAMSGPQCTNATASAAFGAHIRYSHASCTHSLGVAAVSNLSTGTAHNALLNRLLLLSSFLSTAALRVDQASLSSRAAGAWPRQNGQRVRVHTSLAVGSVDDRAALLIHKAANFERFEEQ